MEAVAAARRGDFAAAIVDYQMPGMDGLQLLSRLRVLQPGAARLMVSGALDLDVVLAAVNRGDACRVLAKPISAKRLTNALSEAIAGREAMGREWLAGLDESRRETHDALERVLDGGFEVALQPIVSASQLQPLGFEALLRPTVDFFSGPDEVLQAAESTDQIHRLAEAVATKIAAKLVDLGMPIQLFINLHPEELADTAALLQSYAVLQPLASLIVFEITERGSLPAGSQWQVSIDALRSIGFRIALDDLGSGAASLAALAEIDPDVVKLDMSLVRDIDQERRKRKLVQMLCRFSAAVGIRVVAEGIETEAEADTVRNLGVDMLQGYWLARPSVDTEQSLRAIRAESLPIAAEPAHRSGTRRRRGAVVELAEKRRKREA